MWADFQAGKIVKRTVRDQRGRLVRKSFRVEAVVGEGEEWRVTTAVDEESMTRCTLKLLAKTDSLCKTQVVNEIKNQKRMTGRPNFVELKAVYEDAGMIYLVMAVWGVPLEKILARRRALLQREVQLIFCQLVDMLQNLRAANISHGNIALHSVLVTDTNNTLQLTDFTHSSDIATDETSSSDKNSYKAGSERQSKPKWALDSALSNQDIEEDGNSPLLKAGNKEINEYISPEEYYDDKNANKVSYERDIWACGVLLFKLLTGLFPFTGEGGKLILNKIRFATFSFPSLQDALEDGQAGKALGFVSAQWKELLKRMLSLRSQRITLQELINHPLKLAYFKLKDIPPLLHSHPQLTLLFSAQPPEKQTLFKRSWDINYQEQSEEEQVCDPEEIEQVVELEMITYKRKTPENYSKMTMIDKAMGRDSARTGTVFQKSKDNDPIPQPKHFRLHKTQFGYNNETTKSIENSRAEGGRDKRREKELSIYTPLSAKTDPSKMPELAHEPPFIIKFKFFKRCQALGYILNNSVGVVFEDGQHVVGHSKEEYRYVQEPPDQDSEILIDNTESLNNYARSIKHSIYKGPSKNNFRINKEDSIKLPNRPKTNFLSEQVSVKNLDSNTNTGKYITSNVIDCRFKCTSLPQEKLNVYLKTVQHFGERVVKGGLDVWIDKYWRDGNIFVFLLNTGCWQVAFCAPKGFRVYAVDQFGLSWAREDGCSDLLHCLRDIIRKYQPLTKQSKKQSKPIPS